MKSPLIFFFFADYDVTVVVGTFYAACYYVPFIHSFFFFYFIISAATLVTNFYSFRTEYMNRPTAAATVEGNKQATNDISLAHYSTFSFHNLFDLFARTAHGL